MRIMAYSLLWVMQDLYHQPYKTTIFTYTQIQMDEQGQPCRHPGCLLIDPSISPGVSTFVCIYTSSLEAVLYEMMPTPSSCMFMRQCTPNPETLDPTLQTREKYLGQTPHAATGTQSTGTQCFSFRAHDKAVGLGFRVSGV